MNFNYQYFNQLDKMSDLSDFFMLVKKIILLKSFKL